MKILIWLIPVIPLVSFTIISIFAKKLNKKMVAALGTGAVSVAAIITIITGFLFLTDSSSSGAYTSTLYTWMSTGEFTAKISFLLDPLSLVFCFVITFVGALIHIYSVEFMAEDEGFNRFFAYMNLFVGSMLILVLADNMVLLYLGWEGVGLCSYLLIGFWYKDPGNGYAANKAFLVTRIGDTAMIIGIFLLFISFGTLNINDLMQEIPSKWSSGSPLAILSGLLLLGGAIGKSAQLPFQTWLPDAMAGPSPVSALIHAATMVTAGVYLITRTHVLFTLTFVMTIVAVIGAVTLLFAGLSALAQHDLKRVLAYSTISQVGYMFLAMGIGAWSAAIFHFMIHAFFKALLFLSGGAVIHLLNGEHDIFKMGGLKKRMPLVFYTFIIGAASLSALPLVTAGFYSKDQILWFGWSSEHSNTLLWLAGITGALLTSLYTFRLVFIVFFGEAKSKPGNRPGTLISIPLVILAILSLIAGFIELPENMGPVHLFSNLFGNDLPEVRIEKHGQEFIFQLISTIITLGGIYLAYILFYKNSRLAGKFSHSRLNEFFLSGWRFDELYNAIFVRPVIWISVVNKHDFVDLFNRYIAISAEFMNSVFSRTQTGKLRWYVLFFTAGMVILLAIAITIGI